MRGIVHRDLKPENILVQGDLLAVADFGTDSFTDDLILTRVETQPTQRLANFQYAAPEQRVPGKVGVPADIYALGLMLNELFTGSVPHGTSYKTISSVAKDLGFLDPIVAEMIRQTPADRVSEDCDSEAPCGSDFATKAKRDLRHGDPER